MGGGLMSAPAKEYLIRFYPQRCVQCHGCETACKSWRGLEPGVRFRRVLNLWDGGYPAVKSASLSLSCLHCAEPACVDACPADAIEKRASDGLVLVDPRGCIGCGACAQACPYGVPQFDAEGIMCKCDQCYDQNLAGTDLPCVATCPGKALVRKEVTTAEKQACEKAVLAMLG